MLPSSRKLARQRLQQRFARLDPAAGQMPALGIGVLDQEHAALAVEHHGAHAERQPAREPPIEMQQPLDRRRSPPAFKHFT